MASTPRSSSNRPRNPCGRLPGKAGRPVVISVGRLVYYKGFMLDPCLAWTARQAADRGRRSLRGELQSLAPLGRNRGKVVFAGEIDNAGVSSYYQRRRRLALASVARSEALESCRFEAMAAGLPVVNTSLDSGVPFVSLAGKTGLTVPPGSTRSGAVRPSIGCSMTKVCANRWARPASAAPRNKNSASIRCSPHTLALRGASSQTASLVCGETLPKNQ